MAVHAITVSANYTDGPSSTIYYNTLTGRYYQDQECSTAIRSFLPYARECYAFGGFWSSTSDGTQYTDEEGNFLPALLEKVWSANGTIHAHWTRASYKVAIEPNGGSGGVVALFKSVANREVYDNDVCRGEPVVSVELPSRVGYTCRGIGTSGWETDKVCVDEDGLITDYFRNLSITSNTTRYAGWLLDYTISLNANGGWGGTETVGFDRVRSAFKFTTVEIPEREGYVFNGYFTAKTGGTQRISATGEIFDGWTPSDDSTLYAQWTRYLFKITVNRGSGTGGTGVFYYNSDTGKFYADTDYKIEIDAVDIPYCKFYTFTGLWSASSGGTKYVDADGSILDALRTAAASFTDNVKIYAQYVRLAWTITISGSGTFPAGKTLYGKVSGGIYSDEKCENRIHSIPIPEYELNAFTGIRALNNDTSVLYVNPDGTFTADFEALTFTAAKTVYARWTVVSIKIAISANSGTFTPRAALYYKKTGGGVYNFWTCEGDPATSIPMPTRPGYFFTGCRESNNDTSTLDIDANGILTDSFKAISITSSKTIYARWASGIKVTLKAEADSVVYHDTARNRWSDSAGAIVTAVAVPVRAGYGFLGYFTAEDGGEICVNADGTFVSTFRPSAATTLYAHWGDYSYKITIDTQGGVFERSEFFYRVGEGGIYADAECTVPISSIAAPTRVGYVFAGVWSASSGGSLYITENGVFTASFLSIAPTGPITIFSRWIAKTYTLEFDYNGGSGSVSSKTVTFGQAIGSLPAATKAGNTFVGWYVLGSPIAASTVWSNDGDMVATAKWLNEVGDVTDYFGLSSAALVPISSSNGDNKKRVCVSHTGRYEPGVSHDSGIWRNPTVTYRVIRDMTVNVVLGRAWANSGSQVSGYFITSVEVATNIGEFPTVTVSAHANEGANAINLFDVSIPVQAKAHAQNLLSSVAGGGELQKLTMRAVCDPVVIEENLMPCASDVVRGRYELEAETVAESGQEAPSASSSFASLGEPKGEREGEFMKWNLKARREI